MAITCPPLSRVRDVLGIEFAMFLFRFAESFSSPVNQALMYRKVCLSHYHSHGLCQHLMNGSFNEEEDIVQTEASHWSLVRSLAHLIPSFVSTMVLGDLGDKHSNKLPLLLPLFGHAVGVAWHLVNSVYIDWPMWLMVLGDVAFGIFGGTMAQLMGAFSYLTLVSSTKSRTTRASLLEAALFLGSACGAAISGVVYTHSGFVPVYLLSLILMALLFPYTLFWLKNVKPTQVAGENNDDGKKTKPCSVETVTASMRCVVKKREGRTRLHIWLELVSMMLVIIGGHGSLMLTYLYVKRRPLHWSQEMYSMYLGVSRIVRGLSLLVLLPALKRFLDLRDTSLMIIGIVSNMASEVFFSVSVQTWMVFMVPVLGICSSHVITCMRSLMSRMVGHQEQGKMFAVFAALESLSFTASHIVFNLLYPLTFPFWSGFSFFLGAVILIAPLGITIYMHRELKRLNVYRDLENEDEPKAANGNVQMESTERQQT